MSRAIFDTKFVLLSSLLICSGTLAAYDYPVLTSKNLPAEADEAFLEPDWFDGRDYTIPGLRLSLRNFRRYYEEADAVYGYGLPSPIERSRAFLDFTNFALDNTVGLKVNSPPFNNWGSSVSTPLIPLINRIVTPVNEYDGFRRPVLPPMRWTRDGRVGILGSVTGVDGKPEQLTFHINKPEKLTKSLLDNSPGITTLDNSAYRIPYAKWGIPGAKTAHTVAICDPSPTSNPYACGNGGQDDCYDVTLMGSAVKHSYLTSGRLVLDENKNKTGHAMSLVLPMLEKEEKLFSRQMVIRVSNPKTKLARIQDVTFSDKFQTAPISQGVLFELNLPADGRLAVMRRSGIPLVWRHTTTGKTIYGAYDTVYAVAPNNKPACDASQFGELRPISHAPFDPLVKNKYPFAKYPFRDPMGNPVPDGEDIKGTYPWLDMDAKNLSLTIGDAEIYNGEKKSQTSKHRYKTECLYPQYCDSSSPQVGSNDKRAADFSDKGLLSQFAILGSWTKGKMVVIDNMVNYSDYRTATKNAILVSLYEPGSALKNTLNKSHKVEVGSSRDLAFGSRRDQFIDLKSDGDQENTKYLLKNTTFFDSIENRMNFNKNMLPAMPRDVVWTLSSGATSDEFSFDDLLNNNAFIVSEMVAAYSRVENHAISPMRMVPFDGWNELLGNWSGQVKIQNAATTLAGTWVVPDAGEVTHGRIEPVANGGVKGKGIYFNGTNTNIIYRIPSNQPQDMSKSSWFHSLFIDARELSTTAERVIINFPDKSRLTLADTSSTNVVFRVYDKYGARSKDIEIPAGLVKSKWFHLGIQKTPKNLITFFVNGYPYSEFISNTAFQMMPGELVLGKNGMLGLQYKSLANSVRFEPFKGWMDDYKVFSYQPDYETVCNLAHGTLLAPNTNKQVLALAKLYPQVMHSKISQALLMRGQWAAKSYVCYSGDLNQDNSAKLHSLPAGSISIRPLMHFPEGPLYHDAPRPDSTTNEFCLSCHSDNDVVFGLRKTMPLSYRNGLVAKMDPRRQPTQPHSLLSGIIPHDFTVSNNLKNYSTSRYIDEHLMPSSSGVSPLIANLIALKDDVSIAPLPSAAIISKGKVDTLRLNTSGLTNSVVFKVIFEGNVVSYFTDSVAPFEFSTNKLVKYPKKANRIEATVTASNGLRSSKVFDVFVRD